MALAAIVAARSRIREVQSRGEFPYFLGAKPSPCQSFYLPEWEALTPEQRRKIPPIAPDFVIELRSETDNLKMLQDKMREYLDAGVRLGWLLNPQQQQVEIYRLGQEVEVLNLPAELSGEDVLPGFTLNLVL